MPKRALAEKRPWLLASLIAASAFQLLDGGHMPEPFLFAIKAAAVGLLAIYALLRHAGTDSRLLALVMALGGTGDFIIGLWMEAGAALFFLGHLAAIALYLRHRRPVLTRSQRLAAGAFLLLVPLIAWSLPAERAVAPMVGWYALGLGGMVCAAWSSSFNRYRVGMGAVLFMASDLLLFAQMGPLAGDALVGRLIWPLYYFGQLLICTGVIASLRARES